MSGRAHLGQRRSLLVALILGAFALPLLFSAPASAIDGFFCGTAGSPRSIPAGGNCTGSAYHSNFRAMSSNAQTGPRACVGLSSTPGSLTVVSISCSGNVNSSVWQCDPSAVCPGYGSIWNQGTPGGTYYGWYQYI